MVLLGNLIDRKRTRVPAGDLLDHAHRTGRIIVGFSIPESCWSDSGEAIVVRDGYKRAFDLAIIGVAAVLLFPFWLIFLIAIPTAIWLEDRGPIFYTQERPGRGKKPFRIIKFRTRKDIGSRVESVPEEEPPSTVVGNVLRRFHLDETPQLVNIVMGDMSLVGPRPEWIVRHREICRKLPAFDQRLRVKPGIAGLAQVRGDYWLTPRKKLRYDNFYIKTLNPWMDGKLLCLAVWTVMNREFRSRIHEPRHRSPWMKSGSDKSPCT